MTLTRWQVALAVIGCLAVPACGSDDGDGNADGGGTGGTGGNPGGGSAVQLLTFTGTIAGDMTEATTQCERFASAAPPRLEVTLNGKVAGTDRRLKITIQNYSGAGNYGGNAVQVDIAGTTVSGDEASVAASEKSGTVDSAMNKDGNEVSGAWNCAATPVSR